MLSVIVLTRMLRAWFQHQKYHKMVARIRLSKSQKHTLSNEQKINIAELEEDLESTFGESRRTTDDNIRYMIHLLFK